MNKGTIILLLSITDFSTVLVLSVTEDQNTAIEGEGERRGKRGGEVVNFASLLICFSFECGIGTER